MVPKIVIDTNIYISAIFWGGKPRAVVDLGRSEQVLRFTSSEIEKEIEKKLKTKFDYTEKSPF
ncbi:MAG: putative toxin-antitoxin system toxin component, PIN family [Deltaproteobacteria bacterium]|nr:putative toxin-antitoxin system toxin component, PIN family [Deltaproteobacteria bacterium]